MEYHFAVTGKVICFRGGYGKRLCQSSSSYEINFMRLLRCVADIAESGLVCGTVGVWLRQILTCNADATVLIRLEH